MISARNISKAFAGKPVIQGLNCDISPGQTVCITGPSGCGKTTFFNILMGILKPDAGLVTGVPQKIAAVFQDDRLLDSLTTVLNARLCMDKSYTQGDVKDHLELLGLSDSLYKPVSSLSGGMKKRLGIVRAVLSRPSALFLDEPFNGIDAEGKKRACGYIKRFAKDATVIMVTHSNSEIKLMDAKIFSLEGGRYELDEGAVVRDQ